MLVTGNGTGNWTPTYVGDPFWSRFEIIFDGQLPPSWVSGGVPSGSSNEANFVRALINAWKPAHASLTRITIITAGSVWGYLDGKWGDGAVWIPGGTVNLLGAPDLATFRKAGASASVSEGIVLDILRQGHPIYLSYTKK